MILLFMIPVFSASSHFETGTLEHRFSSGLAWLLLNASVSFFHHKQTTSRVLPPNKLSSLAVWVLKKISEHIQSSWKQNWLSPDDPECTPYKNYADGELSQDSREAFSRQNSRDGSFLTENQGYDRQFCFHFLIQLVALYCCTVSWNGSGKLFDLIPKEREVTEVTSELVCFWLWFRGISLSCVVVFNHSFLQFCL